MHIKTDKNFAPNFQFTQTMDHRLFIIGGGSPGANDDPNLKLAYEV